MTARTRGPALLAGIVIAAVLFVAGAALWLGESLTRAVPRNVGEAPADLPARVVRIDRADGVHTAGWFVAGEAGAGAVLLLHPVRADRRSMLGRARFLHRADHALLLIDLQAHGESPGRRIGLGWREARDVEAALQWLERHVPGERLGVIGVSLGGAAAALARPSAPPAAMVLESVYPDIASAVGNRLRLHLDGRPGAAALAAVLQPLLLAQARLWAGVPAARLEPAAALAQRRTPLLLISGRRDRHTTAEDSMRLQRGAGSHAQLWLVAEAAHEDLHAHAPAAYEARVGAFLGRHLRAR